MLSSSHCTHCGIDYPVFQNYSPGIGMKFNLQPEPKKEPETFGFDKALQLLKEGKRVKRKAWGGYWFIPKQSFLIDDEPNEWANVKNFNRMIVARLKDKGGYAAATPYQEDLLATDWMEA